MDLRSNPNKRRPPKRFILPLLALAFLLFVTGRLIYLMNSHDELYHQYKFRITRDLVKTVAKASTLLKEKGVKLFRFSIR